jgi:hypothetical protein
MEDIIIQNKPHLNIWDIIYSIEWDELVEKIIEDITFTIRECDIQSNYRKWLSNPNRFYCRYWYWISNCWIIYEDDIPEFSLEFNYENKLKKYFLNKDEAVKEYNIILEKKN